jgi:hypothetical protein
MPRNYTIHKQRKAREKHGMTNDRIYRIWDSMKARCSSPNDTSYKKYGAKGISVCDLWKSSFMSFYTWSMENGYKDDLTIDRIDSTKDYSPDNCRWVTRKEQSRNINRNVLLTYKGKTQCISAWIEELGFKSVLLYQLKKRCSSDEEAMEQYIAFNGGMSK